MTTPFKAKGQVIIAYHADGIVTEVDHRDETFATVSDYLKTIDEPEDCIRFIRFSNRTGVIMDVTATVINGWLETVDVLQWDEHFGCPLMIPEKDWFELVDEAREYEDAFEADPHDADDYEYQAWKDNQEDAA